MFAAFRKTMYAVAAFGIVIIPSAALGASQQRARIDFAKANGFTCSTLETGVACVSTDAKINYFNFGGSSATLSVRNIAANSDISFTMTSTGATVPNDNADDDGIEMTVGTTANSPCAFSPGSAYYVKSTFTIPDVSDYDVALVGFRNDTATYLAIDDPADVNTTIPLYTDFAVINVNAGDFRTYTQDDDGTATDTDVTTATWVDGDAHTLMVKVSSAGAVTYFVDGTAMAGAVAFTLDQEAGDIYVPLVVFAKGATTADTPPEIRLFECGLQ